MSLAIDLDSVTAVLLADGWHQVANASFDLDAYEFVPLRFRAAGLGGLGFRFDEKGEGRRGAPPLLVAGPIESIIAVKFEREQQ